MLISRESTKKKYVTTTIHSDIAKKRAKADLKEPKLKVFPILVFNARDVENSTYLTCYVIRTFYASKSVSRAYEMVQKSSDLRTYITY